MCCIHDKKERKQKYEARKKKKLSSIVVCYKILIIERRIDNENWQVGEGLKEKEGENT